MKKNEVREEALKAINKNPKLASEMSVKFKVEELTFYAMLDGSKVSIWSENVNLYDYFDIKEPKRKHP